MNDLIILFMLYIANILACLLNAGLSVYVSTTNTHHKYVKQLFYISVGFSALVVICDVAFIIRAW